MDGKIFYRQSSRSGQGRRELRVVAVTGVDVRFSASHVSREELEFIAKKVGAELVRLDHRGMKGQG